MKGLVRVWVRLSGLRACARERRRCSAHAIARDPERIALPDSASLRRVAGDVHDAASIAAVMDGDSVVLSALGTDRAGTLLTGARAVVAAGPRRVIWLGAKTSLDGALAGTGQAKPGHDPELAQRMGSAFTAMTNSALHVRVSVPVTHQLAQVAAGRMDLHWQFDNVRSHAAGVLLVQEAGGVVTDIESKPWERADESYLAAAPGVHAAALEVLTA
ncbi:inositol monophosphatase family protein [Streptomyces sp. NPDC050988]|uniref:inositol monophosphatase family protein n=1 Tax=Streptomyces sp. NPDC050988 TaxID=3365637 RepID=UPI0037BBEE83